MPVIPPDPWKIAKVTVALYDVLNDALRSGLQLSPPSKEAFDSCRDHVEELRQALAATE